MMSAESSANEPASPGAILDAIRLHPEWDEARKAEEFDRLIGGFSAEVLVEAVLPRLDELGEDDGEIVLQLVEGLANPRLFDALASAIESRPDLSPDRFWFALGVLEGTGRVEASPALAELRDELEDLVRGDDSLSVLAAQIEDDPDAIAVALEGLARIEPEVRAEIIAGLAEVAHGPGVSALLQALAESDDPLTRSAAAEALAGRVGDRVEGAGTELDLFESGPRAVAGAVGAIGGRGRGRIVLVIENLGTWSVLDCECDLLTGIESVDETSFTTEAEARSHFRARCISAGAETAEDRSLALRLLGGATWLSAKAAETRVARLRLALGPAFRPAPVFTNPAAMEEESSGLSSGELAEASRRVLEACRSWRDDSELARSLAVEVALHDGDVPPDPALDPGPYRVLFENRILARIELYRRMLLWSALAWESAGEAVLARDAMRLAVELADPQNAVPGHPFLSALMTRSLTLTGAADARSIGRT